MIRERGIVLEICPTSQPEHARRLRLGRVPLDLRHLPAQRGPLHDQHRRPGDAQDLHPRRAGDARAAWASCRAEEQEQAAATCARRRRSCRTSSRRAAAHAPPARVAASWSARRPSRPGGSEPPLSRRARSLDAVRAGPIARGDVGLADDVGAEDLAEQLELRLAGRRRLARDVEDRAVVLAQPDRPVGAISIGSAAWPSGVPDGSRSALAGSPLLVLDHGQLPDPVGERRAVEHPRRRSGGRISSPLAAPRRRRPPRGAPRRRPPRCAVEQRRPRDPS